MTGNNTYLAPETKYIDVLLSTRIMSDSGVDGGGTGTDWIEVED